MADEEGANFLQSWPLASLQQESQVIRLQRRDPAEMQAFYQTVTNSKEVAIEKNAFKSQIRKVRAQS